MEKRTDAANINKWRCVLLRWLTFQSRRKLQTTSVLADRYCPFTELCNLVTQAPKITKLTGPPFVVCIQTKIQTKQMRE